MITSLTHPCNYEGILNEETEQAKRLAKYLKEYGAQSVLDVGCGPGNYVQAMRDEGIMAWGVDIDPRCEAQPFCRILDITKQNENYIGFPVVLSLEVGEHIPEELSWKYIDFIAAAMPGMVIFSAARPGQGGDGHINCQNKSYWVHRFEKRGFRYDQFATVFNQLDEEKRTPGYFTNGVYADAPLIFDSAGEQAQVFAPQLPVEDLRCHRIFLPFRRGGADQAEEGDPRTAQDRDGLLEVREEGFLGGDGGEAGPRQVLDHVRRVRREVADARLQQPLRVVEKLVLVVPAAFEPLREGE